MTLPMTIAIHTHVYMHNVVSFDCCCFISLEILSLISVVEDLPMLTCTAQIHFKSRDGSLLGHTYDDTEHLAAETSLHVSVFRFSSVVTGARTPPFACEANVLPTEPLRLLRLLLLPMTTTVFVHLKSTSSHINCPYL